MTRQTPFRHRTRPDAGAARRGPTGGGSCRLCGLPVERGRRTFHAVCAEHWLIGSNPGYVRLRIQERDHGVCCRCGLDCTALFIALNDLRYALQRSGAGTRRNPAWDGLLEAVGCARRWRAGRSLWDAHHRHAVAEGGGLCGLEGLVTLCFRCHAVETAALMRRLSASRRVSA